MSYAYDYQGRRVRKTHYASLTTQCFTYDGDQIIADYNEAGVWKRRYYYGPGIDEPICMVRYPGIISSYVNYYHFDGLGSVVALSNNYGQLVEKYKYDVFGQPEIRGPSDEPRETSSYGNRYLFTGREYDSETGNYYYRARYYHPQIGRFIQADPVGYDYSMNLYEYCFNNPLNWIDIPGEIPTWIGPGDPPPGWGTGIGIGDGPKPKKPFMPPMFGGRPPKLSEKVIVGGGWVIGLSGGAICWGGEFGSPHVVVGGLIGVGVGGVIIIIGGVIYIIGY